MQDWQSGDPNWKDGKGKGIIGALNYLASKGMNSVYFLTYSVDGGPEQPLYETDQAYDGDVDKLDVRMIEYQLFKQSTSFIFYVTAVGDASQDKIFFFVPKLAP